MIELISFEEVDTENMRTYVDVGKSAYCAHYRYLWKHGNPSPYIAGGFTLSAVKEAMQDKRTAHFIIRKDTIAVGVIKLIRDRKVAPYRVDEVVFLEKLYLLKEQTGYGIGSMAIRFAEAYGRKFQKKVLLLDAMQKGPAIKFYLREDFVILQEKMLPHPDAIPEEKPMYLLAKPL